MKLTFWGGAGSVTGSNFMLEGEGVKILVDCGFFQGSRVADAENRDKFGYDPASVTHLLVTHAHLDHVGRIPKLVRDGFSGPIYSTPPTRDIAYAMLLDSMRVLGKEAQLNNEEPMYTKEDVEAAMNNWKTVPYHEPFDLANGVQLVLRNSGHVLGSAMMEITINGKKIVLTGDLGNSPSAILKDCEKITDATYMVMESVYGDRNHESHEDRLTRLEDVIEQTVKRGGTLMIPAFSIERTQEILFEIERMMETNMIPLVPVYLDSPLAIKVTDVYKKYCEYLNNDTNACTPGVELFKFPQLHLTETTDESKAIFLKKGPKIIMAGSGMSQGGRIIHHEKNYLPDPKSTLLLVGYQAAGSLGRELQDGAKRVTILGEGVPVVARVEVIDGFSAHMDSDALLEFAAGTGDTIQKVWMAMGEPKSATYLAQRARDYLGINAFVPRAGESVELDF